MKRTLRLFDKLRHVVEREPRPEVAEVAGRDLEGSTVGDGASGRQAAAQCLAHDFLEGSAGEGEDRSHVLML